MNQNIKIDQNYHATQNMYFLTVIITFYVEIKPFKVSIYQITRIQV